jgi:hypothetical protein
MDTYSETAVYECLVKIEYETLPAGMLWRYWREQRSWDAVLVNPSLECDIRRRIVEMGETYRSNGNTSPAILDKANLVFVNVDGVPIVVIIVCKARSVRVVRRIVRVNAGDLVACGTWRLDRAGSDSVGIRYCEVGSCGRGYDDVDVDIGWIGGAQRGWFGW